MATRMADRLKPPDLSTEQLNLKGLMTFRSSHLDSEGKKTKRKRRLAIEYTRKTEKSEMDDTLYKAVCKEDNSKKRRVWAAITSEVNITSSVGATGCKHIQSKATIKATDLVPQHLVGSTPGPCQPHPQSHWESPKPGPCKGQSASNLSSMDLEMGEHKA